MGAPLNGHRERDTGERQAGLVPSSRHRRRPGALLVVFCCGGRQPSSEGLRQGWDLLDRWPGSREGRLLPAWGVTQGLCLHILHPAPRRSALGSGPAPWWLSVGVTAALGFLATRGPLQQLGKLPESSFIVHMGDPVHRALGTDGQWRGDGDLGQ